MKDRTYFLAQTLFDLISQKTSKAVLRINYIVAIRLAQKWMNDYGLWVDRRRSEILGRPVYKNSKQLFSDGYFTNKQVNDHERHCLQVLGWRVNQTTLYDYVETMAHEIKVRSPDLSDEEYTRLRARAILQAKLASHCTEILEDFSYEDIAKTCIWLALDCM